MQTNWPQYGVYAGINKFRHDLVHTKIINRKNNINKKTNLQCWKVIIVIIKHSLFNTHLDYIASKTQKIQISPTWLYHRELLLYWYCLEYQVCDLRLNWRQVSKIFERFFSFTKIIIPEYHLVKRLSDDSFVLLLF